jgi:hypothetical protein
MPHRIIGILHSLATGLQNKEREEVQNFVMLKPAIFLKMEMRFLPQVGKDIAASI